MPLVDPSLVKRHLRVLHDDEDVEIAAYQDAAENIIIEYLDRQVEPNGTTMPGPDDTGYDPTAMLVTPAITAAVLLFVGDLYAVREPDPKLTGDAVLPRSVRALLAPYRVWRSIEETD